MIYLLKFTLFRSKNFSKKQLFIYLLTPALITLFTTSYATIACFPIPEKVEIANQEIATYFSEDESNHVDVGLICTSSRMDIKVIAIVAIVLTGGGYIIVIWCSLKILMFFKNERRQYSLSIQEMNRQLNRTLFAQVIGKKHKFFRRLPH